MAKNVNYVSDITSFVESLHTKDKNLKNHQQELMSTWWDVGFIDETIEGSCYPNELPHSGYVYYDYSSKQPLENLSKK